MNLNKMETVYYDMRLASQEDKENNKRLNQLAFKLNHTMPYTEEYDRLLKDIFGDNLGEGSYVSAPILGSCLDRIKMGKNCYINYNCVAMARGGVEMEDDVKLAANVQLLTNNHDPYDRQILPCKPIYIKEGAWIGAGATILPGVTVGRYAIVGASSVVSKDVPDYAVVVGNPAKVIKTLDQKRFRERRSEGL